ncbi:Gfo/Idh/MocA family oxidoreductase [Alicyclobacillus fastidiosus]|uniref:Gfo/Idh/MocA family oxidoreductase n=1 Tax=Alicyclobacillus fastidiosus TaxID=392011 RepID=A0ABY6ZMA2_9BACL|nr:Gfo/Idh/MocA family oxidoreductase [Alicyclobacillus fastidiosus]WAH43962.1 Gfo/Idh/MocA family oxidoreductase [Alicyclobacillus fastidiosus]GMA60217.1 hypothetical protein GCM10025859_06570 [Alicyclobacillus fastidiosus]
MKIGIISYQYGLSEPFIRCLKQELRVSDVMMCQRVADVAVCHENVAGIRGVASEEALMKEADGVIVLGHDKRRFADILQVLQLEKPLLCDPWLGTRETEAWNLLADVDASDALLIPAFPMRLSPVVANLKEIIASGKLGDIVAVHGVSNTGVTVDFSGGQLAGDGAFANMTRHLVDTILWLLQSKVKSVFCATTNVLNQGTINESAGSVQLVFENGVVAGMASIGSEMIPDTDDRSFSLSVVGTLGTSDICAYGQHVEERTKARTAELHYGDEPMVLMAEEFLRLVAGEDVRRLQLPRLRDCIEAERVLQAACRSVKTGTLVNL